jgi:hypothetical protein
MSESQSFSQSTSRNFEQEVLSRFRHLVVILPSECHIYRETWNDNTVLCLDFQDCPHYIEIIKENVSVLTTIVQRLCLAKSIIFRQGNQLKAWRKCK